MNIDTDEDFPEHPKTVRFCALMGNPLAWGYIWKLWRWCAKFQPDGDLADYTPAELELHVGWSAMDGRFFDAAVRAGFVDVDHLGRASVHNWMRRMGAGLMRMEIDRVRKAIDRARKAGDAAEVTRLEAVVTTLRERLQICGTRTSDAAAVDVHRTGDGQTANGAGPVTEIHLTADVSALPFSALPCADPRARERDPGGTEHGGHLRVVPTGSGDPAAAPAPKLSGHDIQLRFGRVRAAVLGGTPWSSPSDPNGKATTFAEGLTPEAAVDLDPAMALFFRHVKARDPDWEDPRLSSKTAFAFGAFVVRFPDLREELHGTGPPAASKPKARPGEVRYDEI